MKTKTRVHSVKHKSGVTLYYPQHKAVFVWLHYKNHNGNIINFSSSTLARVFIDKQVSK